MSGASGERAAANPRRPARVGRRPRLALPRWSVRWRSRPRILAVLAAVLVLGAGGWWWLRDSSLVAVRQVTVTGVSGTDAGAIRAALTGAARGMTTLDVNRGVLHAAVEPFPVVKALHVSTAFPHRMRIAVVEQVPVAIVRSGGRQTPVAADGTVLGDAARGGPLPTIVLAVAPGGSRLTGSALAVTGLLGAAPHPLLGRITTAWSDPQRGLAAQLRAGPRLYFGTADQLAVKWAAALAVLADSGSAGAVYIDVSEPSRPVAGSGSDLGAAAAGSGVGGSAAAGSAVPASG